MKRKMIPITAMILSAVMLTGCGNNGNAPAGVSVGNTTAADTTEAPKPETTVSETEAVTAKPAGDGYKILVKNESGDPVEGVMVQFCSDSECILGETGADGIAAFDSPDGSYTVHIFKVPEGYEKDDTEYEAPATGGTVELVVKSVTEDDDTEWQDTYDPDITKPLNYRVPEYGITYREPDKYFNAKGYIDSGASYFSGSDPLFIGFCYYYFPFSRNEMIDISNYFEAMMTAMMYNEEIPEAPDERWKSWLEISLPFAGVYITDGDFTEEKLRECIEEYDSGMSNIAEIEKIPSDTDCAVWYVRLAGVEEKAEEIKDQLGEYYDELIEIYRDKETQLAGLSFNDPLPMEEDEEKTLDIGDTVAFEAVDLDGNAVSSGDLFAGHKITMINIWATWCGPCKAELPELGELAKEFEKKGGQIIGLCDDADSHKQIERVKSILSENGCDYLNLRPFENQQDVLPISAYPTTFFVDSEGHVLAEPIVGNDVEAYPRVFEESLKAME